MKTKYFFLLTLTFAIAFISCATDGGEEPLALLTAELSSSSEAEVSSSSGDDSSSSSEDTSSSSGFETVKIGEQVWMAENLSVVPTGDNGAATGNWCYEENESNCEKWGRLYDWATAMALPAECNEVSSTDEPKCAIETPHQGLCPDGYHIPTKDEWGALFEYVDAQNNGEELGGEPYESSTAGKFLKATEGWSEYNNIDYPSYGTDDYGFSALPGGLRLNPADPSSPCAGLFCDAGDFGYWWSSSESDNPNYNDTYAYNIFMLYDNRETLNYYYYKLNGISVRCVKN